MHTVFSPAWGRTTSVTNAVAATAAVVLPKAADEIALANTSPTAIVYVMITTYLDEATVPTGTAPTSTTGFPILPSAQVRLHVGPGLKVIRTIASAVSGEIIITPGVGI